VLRLVLKHVWLQPARLRSVFAAARMFRDSGLPRAMRKAGFSKLLSRRLRFGLALLESSAPTIKTANKDAGLKNGAAESRKANSSSETMLFSGCVGEGLFSRVNRATARVLQVNGFGVQTPREQVCCGALHAHAGDLEGARRLARLNIAAFEAKVDHQAAPIVTNAGGCGAMLASYAHLLSEDTAFTERARCFSARVRDVSQQLETVEIKSGAAVSKDFVTYDSSCHLLYGQHAGEAPLKMVDAVAELNFVRLEGSDRCCGGAGIYNLLEPDLSARVLAEKLANIQATKAKVLATGNPGCQMQIGAGALLAGMNLKVCHPVELLDEAYDEAGMYEQRSNEY
jgi:glycolate oxidase iron-sulfur subunit